MLKKQETVITTNDNMMDNNALRQNTGEQLYIFGYHTEVEYQNRREMEKSIRIYNAVRSIFLGKTEF